MDRRIEGFGILDCIAASKGLRIKLPNVEEIDGLESRQTAIKHLKSEIAKLADSVLDRLGNDMAPALMDYVCVPTLFIRP